MSLFLCPAAHQGFITPAQTKQNAHAILKNRMSGQRRDNIIL